MKVVLLSFLYEPELGGGAAVVVNQLAHLLIQNSYEVTVVTTWNGRSVKTEIIDEIKIIRIPPLNFYWVGEKDNHSNFQKVFWQIVDVWNPWVYRLVRQIVIDEAPDIVHSHKLRGLSPSIWSAASAAGIKKIVHTCHDYELLSPEGFFMGKVGKLAQEQNIVMRPYQMLRRSFSSLVHDATAPSQFVLNFHKKMDFFPRAKLRVIPNSHGFSQNDVQRNSDEASRSKKREFVRNFLFLGRLDKPKGLDILCQAFTRAVVQKPDLQLSITGWGPLDVSLREKYKFQKNIVFTGPIFGSQKSKLLKNSDILIAPSLVQEPFGIVIVEAYSFGLPVITSSAGAFPEIVQEGKTGFLVEPGSVEDLTSAILRTSELGSQVSTMSENCFLEAKKYTIENLLNNYLGIYTENVK